MIALAIIFGALGLLNSHDYVVQRTESSAREYIYVCLADEVSDIFNLRVENIVGDQRNTYLNGDGLPIAEGGNALSWIESNSYSLALQFRVCGNRSKSKHSVGRDNSSALNLCSYVPCRGLPSVLHGNSEVEENRICVNSHNNRSYIGDGEIGPYLRLAEPIGNGDSILSSFRGQFRLISHNDRLLRSNPRVMQRSNYSYEGGKREGDGGNSCPKHSFCPQSHFLLSVQIAFFVLLLPLALRLVFTGYGIADRGLDSLEKGRKVSGYIKLIGGGLIALCTAFILPYLGYWIAFEGGALRLLGIP